MIWSDWSAFIAMGGYGYYVWGAFGMTAAAMAAETWALRSRRRALTTESRESSAIANASPNECLAGAAHEA